MRKHLAVGLWAALAAVSVSAAAQTGGAAQALPSAPSSAAADPFPPANPRFFDVASPTAADVDAFLKAIWGYDANRIWRVEAIQKTQAAGVARVTVFVADKSQGGKVENLRFFTTPDGKHAIADAVFSFGAHPFDDERALLQQRADGPASGAAGKQLELVEFADLQCPHCKEAAPVMEKLRQDFPGAHFVFQNFPLTDIHPFAFQSAAYGNCVAQLKGDPAFFAYLQDVFDHQESLTPELGDTTLNNAVTKAGADVAAVKACAATPAAKAKVEAQVKLAGDAQIDQTPTLVVNGHIVPAGSVPYETLKQIVQWDAQQAGVSSALAK